jgi:hypothetical protein
VDVGLANDAAADYLDSHDNKPGFGVRPLVSQLPARAHCLFRLLFALSETRREQHKQQQQLNGLKPLQPTLLSRASPLSNFSKLLL